MSSRIASVQDLYVTATRCGQERYVWIWAPTERAAVLESFLEFAANPDLSFDYYHAARLTQKVHDMMGVAKQDERCRGK